MSSRRLEDLTPPVQEAAREHLLRCADAGIELLIYCTLRDVREQARLYRQGRTRAQIQRKIDQLTARGFPALGRVIEDVGPQFGPKVTYAGPGESFHQYRLAYDCVPLVDGKAVWKTSGEAGELWQKVGDLGKRAGMEWAGDWKRFREFPHFQMTGGRGVRELMGEHFAAAPAAAGAQPVPRALAAPAAAAAAAPATAAAAAPATAAAAAPATESAALRAALGEANTVFLVFASGAGVADADVEAAFDLARRVANGFNPEVWRAFWVRQPGGLDADLRTLLWDGNPSPAVLLGLGTGLDRRRVATFSLNQLAGAFDVAEAFARAD